jgi:hypothetical protein
VGVVLDTGALLAFERGDRRVAAMLAVARRRGVSVRTSSGCVAQAWRGGGPRQASLARLLRGLDEHGLDSLVSRRIGALLGKQGSHDVVDGHVALLARSGDLVATSDPEEVGDLLLDLGTRAEVLRC